MLQGAKASPVIGRPKARIGRSAPLKIVVGFPAVSEFGYYPAVIL